MFIFWFWLEINMVLFLVLICSSRIASREVDIFSQSLYYFLIQSTASIILLVLFSREDFFSKNYLIILVSILKLGIFPFHFWVYKISEYLGVILLFIILNIQKIPLLIFISNYDFDLFFMRILINIIGSCVFLFYRESLTRFLVSSRICFFNWIFFIIIWRVIGFILFLCKYLIFNLRLLSIKKLRRMADFNIFYSFKIILISVFLMGLPPFFYFFMKLYLVGIFLNLGRARAMLVLWLFSFVCLVCYFNYFIGLIFKNSALYTSFQYLKKSDLVILLFRITSVTAWT